MSPPPPYALFPYTTLFRSKFVQHVQGVDQKAGGDGIAQLWQGDAQKGGRRALAQRARGLFLGRVEPAQRGQRSEEHTSELQSRGHIVCRLLLEIKKDK